MKVEEIPINVQVARALGFSTRDTTRVWLCRAQCISSISDGDNLPLPKGSEHEHRSGEWEIFVPYEYEDDGDWKSCPHYLSSWSKTGPLIDRYDICLVKSGFMKTSDGKPMIVALIEAGAGESYGAGATRLAAVCDLIIKLNPRDYVRA